MSAKDPVVQHTSDIDGNEDGRTVFTYAEAVRLDVEVERDSALRPLSLTAPFVGKVGWGSQSGLTLDQAESFANAVLDGVRRAREDIDRRNTAKCGQAAAESTALKSHYQVRVPV